MKVSYLSQKDLNRIIAAWKEHGKLAKVVEVTGFTTSQCSKNKPLSMKVKARNEELKKHS